MSDVFSYSPLATSLKAVKPLILLWHIRVDHVQFVLDTRIFHHKKQRQYKVSQTILICRSNYVTTSPWKWQTSGFNFVSWTATHLTTVLIHLYFIWIMFIIMTARVTNTLILHNGQNSATWAAKRRYHICSYPVVIYWQTEEVTQFA